MARLQKMFALGTLTQGLDLHTWTMVGWDTASRVVKEPLVGTAPQGSSGAMRLRHSTDPSLYLVPLSTATFSTSADDTAMVLVWGAKAAAIIADEDSGSLRFWADVTDLNAKGLCASSSSPQRVYEHPLPCSYVEGTNVCPLAWQTCNMASGYCFDSSLLHEKSLTGVVPLSARPTFPNCDPTGTGSQPLLRLVPVTGAAQAAENEQSEEGSNLQRALSIVLFVLALLALLYAVNKHSTTEASVRHHQAAVLGLPV